MRVRWSLVVPLLLLAGLLGMHGLAGHGTASHETHAMASPSYDAAAQVQAPPMPSVPSMGAMGLCVVVLVGGLVSWLRRGRSVPVALTRAARSALPAAPRPRSRAPDPPSLLVLSVCRC